MPDYNIVKTKNKINFPKWQSNCNWTNNVQYKYI